MSASLKFKTIVAASLALLIIACKTNKPKKVKVQEVTLQDIKKEEKYIEPPPPPPNDEKLPMEKKCYTIDGLKYKVIVTIKFVGDKYINGWVTSEEWQSNNEGGASFIGTFEGDKLMAKFVGKDPPVVGDASEWTGKPWTIKKEGGKETLHIVFNAKDHDTNKWKDTDYQFVMVDCE